MIVTVTLNPAVDKTVFLDKIHLHTLNRLTNVESDIGGKGINVSKTISVLGKSSIACGFLGFENRIIVEKELKAYGITTDFVYIEGENRTNLKVIEKEGHLTEFNEPGFAVSEKEIALLLEKLQKYAASETIFVFSGSACIGTNDEIYRTFIRSVREKGAKTILDADGALLEKGLEALPSVIKPNSYELAQYFHMLETEDENRIIEWGRKLILKGIETVWITMGNKGALFLNQETTIRIPGVAVEAISSVGAGDALVAAYTYGLDEKVSLEENIKLSIATSVGTVMTRGTKPPTKELIEKIIPRVRLQYLS